MTPKEALEKLYSYQYVWAIKHLGTCDKELDTLKQALDELEALKQKYEVGLPYITETIKVRFTTHHKHFCPHCGDEIRIVNYAPSRCDYCSGRILDKRND